TVPGGRRRRLADHHGAHRRRRRHVAADPLRPHARLEPVVLARGGGPGRARDRGEHLVPRWRRGGAGRDRAARHPEDHDRRHGGHGGRHPRSHRLRRPAVRHVRAHRRRAAGPRHPRPAGGGGMSAAGGTSRWARVWRQLPFFVWLIALWMLLWGQFTPLALLTGTIAAVVVTWAFRLPPVELSGRVNVWWGLVFFLEFLWALVRGSLTVAWQVLHFGRQPGSAVIAVQLRTDDDLIQTHVGVTASLIPGSLILEADRDRRILYLHVIGVHTDEQLAAQHRSVLHWEERIVRAVGSRAQLELVGGGRGCPCWRSCSSSCSPSRRCWRSCGS